MSEKGVDCVRCAVCKQHNNIMKLCTRCRNIFYCSRECQVKDWYTHRLKCVSTANQRHHSQQQSSQTRAERTVISSQDKHGVRENGGSEKGNFREPVREHPHGYIHDDKSIFFDSDQENIPKSNQTHPPLVNFDLAIKKTKQVEENGQTLASESSVKFDRNYLFHNEFYTDLPVLDSSKPFCEIVVKGNRDKCKIPVQSSWTGEEVYKILSHTLRIPLEKLKVIHKGKVQSEEIIIQNIKEKALFQVIGEKLEDVDGLDERDISVMMKQLGLERNAAIKALRSKGDLIDAMLDVANK